jgi:phosphoribosylformimino-5-aminoimidazole carboxamide ribotide isomerase
MKLIPVVDLKGGTVVAARMGHRSDYAPLISPLCNSSRLDAVATALLALHPFDALYVADLDAISGSGTHLPLISSLHRSHPGVEIWIDSGLRDLDRISRFARPVIGTESIGTTVQLAKLIHSLRAPVLSLDFRGDQPMGPAAIAMDPGLWPDDVIVMTLSRVGSDAGPDFVLLRRLLGASPYTRLYAAGGVRDAADLRKLRDMGVAGALVSTALHRGRGGIAALGLDAL